MSSRVSRVMEKLSPVRLYKSFSGSDSPAEGTVKNKEPTSPTASAEPQPALSKPPPVVDAEPVSEDSPHTVMGTPSADVEKKAKPSRSCTGDIDFGNIFSLPAFCAGKDRGADTVRVVD